MQGPTRYALTSAQRCGGGQYSAEGSILTLSEQLKYMQIAYVVSPTQAEGIPWVVIAVDPGNPIEAVLIHEIEECSPWIETHDREYLEALLADWNATLNKDGNELLESLSGLAIGPLRTSASGQCSKEQLSVLVSALKEEARKGPPPQTA